MNQISPELVADIRSIVEQYRRESLNANASRIARGYSIRPGDQYHGIPESILIASLRGTAFRASSVAPDSGRRWSLGQRFVGWTLAPFLRDPANGFVWREHPHRAGRFLDINPAPAK